MRNRNGGDASLLLGLIFGLAVGAAIVVIINAALEDDTPSLPEARASLESKAEDTKARVEGAAEGATE
ncbi:MAG TPA: hypothetical protein VM409_05925 [Chloroflexia bacterium]|nr:hypothetical protein [Chloroflexia bacterium]